MKTIFGAHAKLFPLVLGMGVGHLSNKSLSPIFIWLVFQSESDWILKEKNPFLKKQVDLHQATFRSNYYF